MNNGPSTDSALPDSRHSSGDLLPRSTEKRKADTTSDAPAAKKACGCSIVKDTVLAMMEDHYTQDNKALGEDNLRLASQLEEATRFLLQSRRREHLLRVQLEAAHRYSRMVAQWVPQVEEMFSGDLETIINIQAEQTEQLEQEIRDEDPGETTEEEDWEEE